MKHLVNAVPNMAVVAHDVGAISDGHGNYFGGCRPGEESHSCM
jgi:hypothetical protein